MLHSKNDIPRAFSKIIKSVISAPWFPFLALFTVFSVCTNLLLACVSGEYRFFFRTILDIPFYLIFLIPIFISARIGKKTFQIVTGIIVSALFLQFLMDISGIFFTGALPRESLISVLLATSFAETLRFIKSFSIFDFSLIGIVGVLFLAIIVVSLLTIFKKINLIEGFAQKNSHLFILVGISVSSFFVANNYAASLPPPPSTSLHASLRGILKRKYTNVFASVRIFHAYVAVKNDDSELTKIANSPQIPSRIIDNNRAPIVGIVVIGESATRDHHSLYGYARKTTPNLEKYSLELFSDAITTSALTKESVTNSYLLKFPDRDICATTSQVLSAGGARCAYISSQALFSSLNTPFFTLFKKAEIIPIDRKENGDADVLPVISELLDKRDKTQDFVLFIHLNGSHQPYSRTYPKGWGSFGEETITDTYDNSISYTDFVLSEMIKFLKKEDPAAFMLYHSDHGEAAEKNRAEYRNHIKGIPAIWEIPLFVWFSDSYKSTYTKTVNAVRSNKDLAVQTSGLGFSVLDLMQFRYKKSPFSKSIASEEYIPPKQRKIFHDRFIYDKTKRSYTDYLSEEK